MKTKLLKRVRKKARKKFYLLKDNVDKGWFYLHVDYGNLSYYGYQKAYKKLIAMRREWILIQIRRKSKRIDV